MQILFGKEARQKIKDGLDKVAKAVVTTLGPMGRNVVISRSIAGQQGIQHYQPMITKDGVTVARDIFLDDHLENTGALIIREAAEKTMLMAGDGTTTTCLLTAAIVEKGLELVEAGANPMELKRGIDQAVVFVVEELKKMAIPVGHDIEKIRQVATVSANNDSSIGVLIAQAFEKIGVDGVINIEESKGFKTEIKVTDGFRFDRGWISPYFITNQAKHECELINPYILLYDKRITTIKQIENAIGITTTDKRPLFIVCEDADGEALAGLAMNVAQKRTVNGMVFSACIVRCPEFGDTKRESMEDLAVITGATYISDEKGKGLEKVQIRELGGAAKVIVGKDETVIISGEGKKEQLTDLLNTLKTDLVRAEGAEKEKLERRIAKLQGSIAVLYVGAPTEMEMKERKDRCDDAVRATKAAIEEGFVPGGGTAFLRIGLFKDGSDLTDREKGERLINLILSEPLRQICKNAGVDDAKAITTVRFASEPNFGYNAKKNAYEDLVESGIIDPVKVLRCSLENAASAATMIITSECLTHRIV